ncbi:MAG: hypothetical protein LBE91_13140 [Tannerella sp.]|jgi:hypothetical protein|nr:hypothetical protein [Tannerella sp.]
MEREKGYVNNPVPSIPFPSLIEEMLELEDNIWKSWIFHYLLLFYEKYNRAELKQKIENEQKRKKSRIEKTIADFLRKWLRNNTEFNKNIGFRINRESLSEGDYESYYDIIIEHSFWDKMFCFECKNLTEKQELIKKYVDGGLYRYFNGKYAQQQYFGGMLGFVLEDNYLNIKDKIHKKLKEKFDITPEGDLLKISDNSIQQNDFTFDSYHNRKNKEFIIHHLLFNICQ